MKRVILPNTTQKLTRRNDKKLKKNIYIYIKKNKKTYIYIYIYLFPINSGFGLVFFSCAPYGPAVSRPAVQALHGWQGNGM